ncbi:MAG TPA: protein-L-isoaspartate(D-aspartate) O-methyltransferase [Pirellulaceae bacterium]|nr:protein-L-isoaspartate(D-aspartate) O-methyltransferase [Pirellulaceae bacterium]
MASHTDLTSARAAMIQHQLRARGLRDERVLAAMGRVPRESFIPESIAHEAYLDCALPIDCGQTISQPIIVAMMTEALQLTGNENVLEIGTGSGYQTAILAELAAAVFSIERHADLAHQAETRLKNLGYRNVVVRTGDGSLGWPDEAPFDRIIVTAAAPECPPVLWDQLKEGGILVGPFGPTSEQALYEMHKIAGQPQSRILTGCRFVPLVTARSQ